MTSRLAALGSLVLASITASVVAAEQDKPPQFRSRVDLVHLDVSVLDNDRRPLKGLTERDFTIYEDGKPQAVAAFTAVDLPDPIPPPTPWMREVASDVRRNTEVADRRLVVIVMDDATIPFDLAMIKGAREIGRQAVERLGSADLACIVFTRDNRNAQEFTNDRARLLKAIEAFDYGGRQVGLPPNSPPSFELAESNAFYASIGTLSRVAESLAALPERRKAVIYVTVGVPADLTIGATPVLAGGTGDEPLGGIEIGPMIRRVFDYMRETYRFAQRANVNVYTVSPAGVGGMAAYIEGQRMAGKHVPAFETANNYFDFLVGVAENTGGRAFPDRNEFNSALTSIFQENGSYYLLGYQAPNPALDGKFRRVEVRVNRPDVTVRTRNGYYNAKADAAAAKAAAPLTAALAGLLPKTDVPLEVTAAPFAIPGKAETGIAIVLTVHEDLPARPSRTVHDVDLQVAAFTQEGKQQAAEQLKTQVTLRPGPAGPAEYEVLSRITLRPGRYQLRLSAKTPTQTGSVYYDIDVPDFGSRPLSISGIVLSSEPRPVSTSVDRVKSLVPIAPTARREFFVNDKATVFAQIYQGGRDPIAPTTVVTKITDATGTLRVNRSQLLTAADLGGGGAGRMGQAQQSAGNVVSTERSLDFRMELPLKTLPAGEYLFTLEASTARGVARRDLRFRVK